MNVLDIQRDKRRCKARMLAVANDYASGMPLATISRKYGIAQSYACVLGRTFNQPRRIRKIDPHPIITAYMAGEKVLDICSRFQLELSQFYKILKRMGVTCNRRVRCSKSS